MMTQKKQNWVHSLGEQAEDWSDGTRTVAQQGMDYINELAKHSQSSRFHELLDEVDATIKLLAMSTTEEQKLVKTQDVMIASYEQLLETLKQLYPGVREYLTNEKTHN